MSSIIFVLITCGARKQKKTVKTKEARQECRVSLIKTHRRVTSISVLTVHAETSQLYTFQRSMQANRNINQLQ